MIRQLVPKRLKQYIRQRHQRYVLGRSVREFAELTGLSLSPGALLSSLIYGWGNEGFSAEQAYLLALTGYARRMTEPILECGSGLSTLLLGIAAQQNENRVWTLEHHPAWAKRVKASLNEFGINSVELCVAPLRYFDECDWYDAPLEKMPKSFSLVVCDGPPGDTRGGRYGMLPVMRERLSPGCVILADDASREGESAMVRRWATELNTEAEMSDGAKPFATLVVP